MHPDDETPSPTPPSGISRAMSGVLDAYRRVMSLLAITSIAAILLAVGAQVVARYVFGASFRWSDELSRYMLVWVTFIFAGIALERGEMIALDLLDRINARALRVAITLATSIPVLAALAAIVYYGYRYAALNASQSSPTLGISMFTVYLAIPIGLTLLALHVLAIALRDIARQFARG